MKEQPLFPPGFCRERMRRACGFLFSSIVFRKSGERHRGKPTQATVRTEVVVNNFIEKC